MLSRPPDSWSENPQNPDSRRGKSYPSSQWKKFHSQRGKNVGNVMQLWLHLETASCHILRSGSNASHPSLMQNVLFISAKTSLLASALSSESKTVLPKLGSAVTHHNYLSPVPLALYLRELNGEFTTHPLYAKYKTLGCSKSNSYRSSRPKRGKIEGRQEWSLVILKSS